MTQPPGWLMAEPTAARLGVALDAKRSQGQLTSRYPTLAPGVVEVDAPPRAVVPPDTGERMQASSVGVRLGVALVAFFSGICTLGTGMQRVLMASGYGGVLIVIGILLASGAIALVASAPSPDPPAPGWRRKQAPLPVHPHRPSAGGDGSPARWRDSKKSRRTACLPIGSHSSPISRTERGRCRRRQPAYRWTPFRAPHQQRGAHLARRRSQIVVDPRRASAVPPPDWIAAQLLSVQSIAIQHKLHDPRTKRDRAGHHLEIGTG